MRRSRSSLLIRLAVVAAGPLVASASGHEPPAPLLLGVPDATLLAHPLSPVVEPPRLLELPRDVVPVALDFAPPVPEVDQRQQDDRAVQRAANHPEVVQYTAQALPTEEQRGGLFGASSEANKLPETAPAIQRLPPVQRERAALPPRAQAFLPALEQAAPTRMASRPEPQISSVPVETIARVPQRSDSPMLAVRERALAMVKHGGMLADRGAFFSARAEFIQALRVTTQALDAQSGTTDHSQALAEGLRALAEADSFSPVGSQLEADMNLASVVAGHRTPVLKQADLQSITPLVALQRYYTFAQERLAQAGGQEPASSAALYGLGKLTTVMAQQSPDERRLHGPKAMALYQAALMVDANNHRAAAELGVLLASFGQWQEAKRALLQSAEVSPTPETWHNLSVVHAKLGEDDLSKRARYEQQLALRERPQTTSAGPSNTPQVQWVDNSTFAKTSPEVGPPAHTARTPEPPAKRSATRPGSSGPRFK